MQGNPSPRGWRAVARRCAWWALAAVALHAFAACGPSVRIEPLIGEEPELLQHVATTVPDLSDHAPTRAVRALHDALVREDMSAAWNLLTAETHTALDEAARTVAAPGGEALFRAAPREGIPLLRDGAAPLQVSPLTWLLTDEIAWVRLSLDPEAPPEQTDTAATVYLIDAENRYREVRLRKEGDRWRVHQPTVRYGDLAAYLP